MLVEVCANSLQSALTAQQAGAQRIELCVELLIGGITPSYGLIKAVTEGLEIPVHVLIRPRSGDFFSSDLEFKTMLQDIEMCVSLGAEGIVSGVLTPDHRVDWERTSQLLKASGPSSFTFHRAFDWIASPLDAFLKLQDMGVNIILSSGQAATAVEGLPLLLKLKHYSDGCAVMPGGGIRDDNALRFKKEGFQALHLSAAAPVRNSGATPSISMNSSKGLAENQVLLTDMELLKKVIKSVN
jgi:copper homeostasis protein